MWIAANLGESRVPKSFASSARIQILCHDIQEPEAPFALRLSAALLLGVTRVHSRKTSIIIGNLKSVMFLLKRNSVQTFSRARQKKRRGLNSPGGLSEESHPADDHAAPYGAITIPLGRERRSGINKSLRRGRRGKRARRVEAISSPRDRRAEHNEGSDAFQDVGLLTAMDTLFTDNSPRSPYIPSPFSFEGLSLREEWSGQLRFQFNAREQDITLRPDPGAITYGTPEILGSQEEQDVALREGAAHVSNDSIFHDALEEQQDFANTFHNSSEHVIARSSPPVPRLQLASSGQHVREPSPQHAPAVEMEADQRLSLPSSQRGIQMQGNDQNDGILSGQMDDLPVLDISTPSPVGAVLRMNQNRHIAHQSPHEVSRQNPANVPIGENNNNNESSALVPNISNRDAHRVSPGSSNYQVEPELSPWSSEVPTLERSPLVRSGKKRLSAVIHDQVTEFPMDIFRENLISTGDLVLSPSGSGRDRRKRQRRSGRKSELNVRLNFLNAFPDAVRNIFDGLIGEDSIASSGPDQNPMITAPPLSERESLELSDRYQSPPSNLPGDLTPSDPSPEPVRGQNERRRLRPSGVEVQRGGTGGGNIGIQNISIPSSNQDGLNISAGDFGIPPPRQKRFESVRARLLEEVRFASFNNIYS